MKNWRTTLAQIAGLGAALIPAMSSLAISLNLGEYIPIETSTGAVTPGEWNASISAGQEYADAHNIPMLAIGGSAACSHCHTIQTVCNTDEFEEWADRKKIVMVFGEDAATRKECKPEDSSSLPFVWVHWLKPDGTVIDKKFSGNYNAMPSKEGETLAGQLINSCDLYIGAYPKMTGFERFAFTDGYANARLEAEAGKTAHVDVPLVRDAFMKGFASTNLFTATFQGETIAERVVAWNPETLETSVRVEIPDGAVPGDEIVASLSTLDGEDLGSVKIFVVEEKENSTKNPLFVGERTAATLGYGEWTMDLDVAMEKYAAEPEAHLMAIASGSLWCPDCVMTDEHVLETEAFKNWAVENKVILVDIDVPNFPNTTNSACLLTYVTGRTSDGYVSGRGTLATNELERYQSGAGYLSRHMVAASAAKAVLERNRSLVGRNTLEGGWNDPNRANQNRTGIPNFFALSRDGSLVGTFETFDAIGPSEFKDAYLLRFSELIALEDEGGEDFPNRAWQTTEDVFSGEGEAKGTLTAIDLNDTFALDSIQSGAAVQNIVVKGADASASVTVNLIAVSGSTATTVATESGSLAGGVGASCTMTPGEKYYVQVVGAAKGTLAADSAKPVTAVSYTVSGTREAIANPYSNDWLAKAAKATLPLYSKDGDGLAGSLDLQLKKNGKLAVKISGAKGRLANIAGVWDADIAADGTATATLQKNGWTVALAISGAGVVAADVTGPSAMASGQCALADDYGDFAGVYAVALPLVSAAGSYCGDAYMTLSMGRDKASSSRGRMKYKVFLPDGKKLSGTTGVTGWDANFGVVPIAKTSGANTFRASLLVRRNAATAPTRRAVMAASGVKAVWQGSEGSRECGVFGSFIDPADSLAALSDTETLSMQFDVSTIGASEKYGALAGVAYGNGAMGVSSGTIQPAQTVRNFAFKLNRKTGVFSGKTALSFTGKEKVNVKFSGVILPGWFSDCECQEDEDTVVPMVFLPFGAGQGAFPDVVGGRRVKRSFPVSLGSSSEVAE